MGLDMYLSEEIYLGCQYDWKEIEGNLQLSKKYQDQRVAIPLELKRISSINQEVGYWRKANQIHRWFVENCQGGEDDCRDAPVSIEQLTQLLGDVRQVIGDHDSALYVLPSEAGFFFGGLEYDEWYFRQLRETRSIILRALRDYETFQKCGIYLSFHYHSSW